MKNTFADFMIPFKKPFPFIHQLGLMDCGPVCLQMIGKYYGKNLVLEDLKKRAGISKVGVDFLGICEAAESVHLKPTAVLMNLEALLEDKPFPCIIHWNQNHFVVLHKLTRRYAYVADPANGLQKYTHEELCASWLGESETGIVLLIEPTSLFYEPNQVPEQEKPRKQWNLLKHYILRYKRFFFQILLGFLVTSGIIIFTPFLTKAIVDQGIEFKNIHFIYLILAGQLFLFLSAAFIEVIRGWLLLHIGTRINILILSEFFSKLFKLPVSFFDTHITGELIQRVEDHRKIESLLTVNAISTIFALINLIVLGLILLSFNPIVFLMFLSGGLLSFMWVSAFKKKRSILDYKSFEVNAKNHSKLMELFQSVEEIKISNSANQKRWEWEAIQAKLFRIRIRYLALEQKQTIGARLLQQIMGILVTVYTATLVINGSMTIGTMFAINMMIGELNSPLQRIISFIPEFQDAKLSLRRINEIHNHVEEQSAENQVADDVVFDRDIRFENVSFSYTNHTDDQVLKHINITIPYGKTTAIVGASGGGKTTLFKLLLQFYAPTTGNIYLGDRSLQQIRNGDWRDKCGVVFQDGKILSDTIVNNISMGQPIVFEAIVRAATLANIHEYIEEQLPQHYYTKIGNEGLQLSVGQQQRILLARAIYKNPDFLLLDEATSALDTHNERTVIENINAHFKEKTILVIAHRLSTVKNADQILVLGNGAIVESGTHKELLAKRGDYFHLVKDQLQLESLN